MTPEGRVKKDFREMIKAHTDAKLIHVAGSSYGGSGEPDYVLCYKGVFVGVECKAAKAEPTKLQEACLKEIAEAGGIGLCLAANQIRVFQMMDGEMSETLHYTSGVAYAIGLVEGSLLVRDL